MLALPVLIYVTTSSPKQWVESHFLQMPNAGSYLNTFAKRSARNGTPLSREQRMELLRIISEEFKQTEVDALQNARPQTDGDEQRVWLEQCDERIARRAEPLLEERQWKEFQAYQRRQSQQRVVPADEPTWGRTAPFYRCLIDLYFFMILPLNCVRMCGALIRDELEANTMSFLTTRPLSRARLLVVKFLSQTAVLQIWFLAQTVLVFIAGQLRDIPALTSLLPSFLGAQVLAVTAWSALGLFLGLVSKRYMALAVVYGAIVEMGIGRIPTNINALSLMRHLKGLLVQNEGLQNVFHWSTGNAATAVSALVFGAVLFLILGTLLFTYKEYHHTAEMQK